MACSVPARRRSSCAAASARSGYIQKIGFHASLAIVREMAKDPTLMAYSPDLADVLVVPANGQGPTQGPGEAIEEGYVPRELAEADDFHLGN